MSAADDRTDDEAESSAGHVCVAGIWLPINSQDPDKPRAAARPAQPRRPAQPLVETATVRRNLRSLALAVCQARCGEGRRPRTPSRPASPACGVS